MDNQAISGAPGTIKLGDRTYLVAQPDHKDIAAIGAYLNKRAKSPVQALQEDPDFQRLPAAEREPKLDEAARRKFDQAMPYDGKSVLDALTSPDGVRFMAWLLIRKADPSVQYEEIEPLVTAENADLVHQKLSAASGLNILGN